MNRTYFWSSVNVDKPLRNCVVCSPLDNDVHCGHYPVGPDWYANSSGHFDWLSGSQLYSCRFDKREMFFVHLFCYIVILFVVLLLFLHIIITRRCYCSNGWLLTRWIGHYRLNCCDDRTEVFLCPLVSKV